MPIPTTDGRLFINGVVVMTSVSGGPPETEADWRRVADTLVCWDDELSVKSLAEVRAV